MSKLQKIKKMKQGDAYNCEQCGKKTPYSQEDIDIRSIGFTTLEVCESCQNDAKKQKAAAAAASWAKEAQRHYETIVDAGLRATDTNHPSFNQQLWNEVKKHNPTKGNLGIIGVTGLCKSRCVALLLKSVIYKYKHRASWCSMAGLHGFEWAVENKKNWNDCSDRKAQSLLKKWQNAPFLVIDDIGKEVVTPALESALFGLLDYRINKRKPFVWTANTNPEQRLANGEFSKDRGAPIVGRLLGYSAIIDC